MHGNEHSQNVQPWNYTLPHGTRGAEQTPLTEILGLKNKAIRIAVKIAALGLAFTAASTAYDMAGEQQDQHEYVEAEPAELFYADLLE
jgi:hypothetical protein